MVTHVVHFDEGGGNKGDWLAMGNLAGSPAKLQGHGNGPCKATSVTTQTCKWASDGCEPAVTVRVAKNDFAVPRTSSSKIFHNPAGSRSPQARRSKLNKFSVAVQRLPLVPKAQRNKFRCYPATNTSTTRKRVKNPTLAGWHARPVSAWFQRACRVSRSEKACSTRCAQRKSGSILPPPSPTATTLRPSAIPLRFGRFQLQ